MTEFPYRLTIGLTATQAACLVGLLVAAAILLAIGSRRKPFVLGLRLSLLVLFAWFALDPQLETVRQLPPKISVLIDDSASMTRHSQAIRDFVFSDSRYRVETKRLSELLPNRNGSLLGLALLTLRHAQEPPDAIVLLSDGNNVGGPPLEKLSDSLPIIAVGVGDSEPLSDLRWKSEPRLLHAFAGQTIHLTPTLEAVAVPQTTYSIDIHIDGLSELPSQIPPLEIGPEFTSQKINITIPPQPSGEHRFRLTCSQPEFDAIPYNNTVTFRLDTSARRCRILLLEEQPRYEFRFLRNLLRNEPAFDLAICLLDADPETVVQDENAVAFETLDFDGYDIIVLGDVDPNRLGNAAMKQIAAALSNEDSPSPLQSVVFLAGERFMPVAYPKTPLGTFLMASEFRQMNEPFEMRWELDPILPDRDEINVKLATLRFYTKTAPIHPGTGWRVLAFADEPIIATKTFGVRKVLWLGTDELWRLRTFDGGEFYRQLWLRLLHVSPTIVGTSALFQQLTDHAESDEQELIVAEWERTTLNRAALEAIAEIVIDAGEADAVRRVFTHLAERVPPHQTKSEVTASQPLLPRPVLFVTMIVLLTLLWFKQNR